MECFEAAKDCWDIIEAALGIREREDQFVMECRLSHCGFLCTLLEFYFKTKEYEKARELLRQAVDACPPEDNSQVGPMSLF